jgi:hypothetical protein
VNFMRSLGSAILVAAFGAILLSGLGTISDRAGTSVEAKIASAAESGVSLASAFTGVFIAAAICAAIALILVLVMEERPLRGGHVSAPSSMEH